MTQLAKTRTDTTITSIIGCKSIAVKSLTGRVKLSRTSQIASGCFASYLCIVWPWRLWTSVTQRQDSSSIMPEFKKDHGKLFRTADEVDTPEEAAVEGGTIPAWINGSFIRVGPAKFDFDNTNFTVNHWLDGYALLSKFEINSTKQTVTYRSKYLESESYKKAVRAGKPLVTEFGTKAFPDPAKNMFTRFFTSLMPEMSDNDSVSLFQLGKGTSSPELFVTSNTQYFHQISSTSLETGSKFDYHKCFGFSGVCVHPVHDPTTGDTYSLGFSITTGVKYNFIKIPAKSGQKITNSSSSTNGSAKATGVMSEKNARDLLGSYETVCSIPSRWKGSVGFFHSFGVTANYIIFIEQPYSISLPRAAKSVVVGDSFKDWLDWRPKEKSKFYIIEKSSGHVIKTEYYSTEPFFFLHVINCFEDMNNQIVIDLITYKSPAVLESMYLSKLRNNMFEYKDGPFSQRFVLPVINNINEYESSVNLLQGHHHNSRAEKIQNSIILTPEVLSEYELELPTIAPSHLGKDYKYFYAVCDGNANLCTDNNHHQNHHEDHQQAAGAVGSSSVVKQDYSKNALCKVNIESKKTHLWQPSEYYVPGEPIFLSNPDNTSSSADEDNGVLISAVTDLREGQNDFLIFLNARSMEEIGRANFKSHLPQAMHGIFLQN